MALAAGAEHLALSAGGRATRAASWALADAGSPSCYLNTAMALCPGADHAEVDEWFSARPGGGVLLLSPFPTPDLEPGGWELVGHPPLMYRPASPAAAPAGSPGGLRISEVHDDEALADFEAVLVEGFPLEELQPARPGCLADGRALADGSFRAWVGTVDRQPVSAAAAHVGSGPVVVSWVATLPEYRGRGYGEALTRHALGADRNRPAVLLASDPGRPVYERIGFTAVLRLTAWVLPHRRPL